MLAPKFIYRENQSLLPIGRRPSLTESGRAYSSVMRDLSVLSKREKELVHKMAGRFKAEFVEVVRILNYVLREEELCRLIPLLQNDEFIEELTGRANSVELIRAGSMFLQCSDNALTQLSLFETWVLALTGPKDFWNEGRIQSFKLALLQVYDSASPLFHLEINIPVPIPKRAPLKRPVKERAEFLAAIAGRFESLSEQGRKNLVALLNDREFIAHLAGRADIVEAFRAGFARRITSHEARSVLGVLGMAKDLASRLRSPDLFRDKVDFFSAKLPKYRKALLTIIAFILNAAKADKFKEKSVCSIGSIIEDAVSDLQATRHGIRIDIYSEAGNSLIACDRTALRFAVFNLILNSAEHKATEIRVHIRIATADLVQISIIDNGEGFDRSIKDRILETGFTTKSKGKGHGHGTKVVNEIAKNLGGRFDIGSPGIGRGCCADIFLPIVNN